ncbi:MAG: ISKra4 family transposase, partial [Candidatus Eisenbacteria bacterium]|nr:ISKra4 family transposase [Candidatus Eisenbacteria bacterium]
DRGLATVFGPVTVERAGHGAEGEASLYPLDGQLNLPEELYSHELRRRAAEEASKSSFDETVETLAKYTGTRIAKRQVEEIVVRAAQDFDAFYESRRQESQAPRAEQGSVLVITTDGKGVVMHKDDLRPATRKAAERRRNKMTTRLSKGEKRNRKRMATVAAVYTVAPYVRTPEQVHLALARSEDGDGAEELPRRPRPEHKRVWASLVQEPAEVLEEAFREALDRDPDREKSWVSVVDGDKHQLRILKDLAKKHGVQLTIIVDIIHVLEYLWKAGHALAAKSGCELEPWVLKRLGRTLEGQASQVAAGMRRSATLRHLGKNQRAPVDACADYLLKYKNYLAYDQYLAAGFPIGSGVIEGACRHLVKDRLDLTGARWRLTGAEAILHLRALRSSHDFEEYWLFHEAREYDRNHRARYADGVVPSVSHPSQSRPPKLKPLP